MSKRSSTGLDPYSESTHDGFAVYSRLLGSEKARFQIRLVAVSKMGHLSGCWGLGFRVNSYILGFRVTYVV